MTSALIFTVLYERAFASLCYNKKHAQISMAYNDKGFSVMEHVSCSPVQYVFISGSSFKEHYLFRTLIIVAEGKEHDGWTMQWLISLFGWYISIIPHISLTKANHMIKPNVNAGGKCVLPIRRDCKSHGNV